MQTASISLEPSLFGIHEIEVLVRKILPIIVAETLTHLLRFLLIFLVVWVVHFSREALIENNMLHSVFLSFSMILLLSNAIMVFVDVVYTFFFEFVEI